MGMRRLIALLENVSKEATNRFHEVTAEKMFVTGFVLEDLAVIQNKLVELQKFSDDLVEDYKLELDDE
jgi:hypothetical protein